jgi:putative Ca2+/H+ antiporter (TMEM165/GDT1 family)
MPGRPVIVVVGVVSAAVVAVVAVAVVVVVALAAVALRRTRLRLRGAAFFVTAVAAFDAAEVAYATPPNEANTTRKANQGRGIWATSRRRQQALST